MSESTAFFGTAERLDVKSLSCRRVGGHSRHRTDAPPYTPRPWTNRACGARRAEPSTEPGTHPLRRLPRRARDRGTDPSHRPPTTDDDDDGDGLVEIGEWPKIQAQVLRRRLETASVPGDDRVVGLGRRPPRRRARARGPGRVRGRGRQRDRCRRRGQRRLARTPTSRASKNTSPPRPDSSTSCAPASTTSKPTASCRSREPGRCPHDDDRRLTVAAHRGRTRPRACRRPRPASRKPERLRLRAPAGDRVKRAASRRRRTRSITTACVDDDLEPIGAEDPGERAHARRRSSARKSAARNELTCQPAADRHIDVAVRARDERRRSAGSDPTAGIAAALIANRMFDAADHR